MIFKYFYILFLILHSVQSISDDYVFNTDDFVFDSPDFSADFEHENKNLHLEAFKSTINDKIIKDRDIKNYDKLFWTSLGYPEAYSFDLDDSSFSVKVKTLTRKYKLKLAEIAKKEYGIEVQSTQILKLVPNKLECQASFHDEENNLHTIKGAVENFHEWFFRVEFQVPIERKKKRMQSKVSI